jgi:hypothetical protein
LTGFSLQQVTTETGFYSRTVQVIFVVITVTTGQCFFPVLPFTFDIVSSILRTHLLAAVIKITSRRGLEIFK